ncbi:SNF2 domain-containing protein [Melia azedarach]|uniref:SNF2 domain-containing protein n=1 Tax=Melia azedarach TaxID=155640 RepID=A0ACC1XMG8_MELAZ|nr:SNF2 domain-containing protein [Melia azedarach]
MMDYSLPVARRTRSRAALMFRELHETIRKKKRQENCGAESFSFKVDKGVEVNEKVHVVEEEEISAEEVNVASVGGDSDSDSDYDGFEEVHNLRASHIERFDDSEPILVDSSEPILVDGSEDDLVFLGEEDDLGVEKDDDDIIFIDVDEEIENNGKSLKKVCRKNEEKDKGKLAKSTKKKCIRRLENDDVQSILINSILNGEEISLEDSLVSYSDDLHRNELASETSLPLKFTFGIEEVILPEKSEYEKELDNLWAEMDFALKASEIASTNPPIAENEVTTPHKLENGAASCDQGNHELILDDEIGILCKSCSFVKLEIRYIMPSFDKCHRERSSWRDPNMVDHSILHELYNHDTDLNSQSGCDSCSHLEGTVWDLVPGVKNNMYPHQRDGFEFIWKNIAGGIKLDDLKNSTNIGGNGCIISHAPGTGKTRLTMVFLQSYMTLYPRCRPVIVAPRSMLLTWEEEFQKWGIDIPFHNLNKPELSGKENSYAVNLINQVKPGEGRVNLIRMVKLYSWEKDRGTLGLSYRLFDKLVSVDEKSAKSLKKGVNNFSKILLEVPGLFVFDEGHTPRNDETCMFKALSKIKTERRIILSGTPFQNNFEELGNTLGLVLPKFAEKKETGEQRHGLKKRGRKSIVEKGILASLTGSIGKVADDRFEEKLEELRNMIAPFVHIHKGTVLLESLPGLRHSVVVLQPDDFQKRLFEAVQGASLGALELNYRMSLISIHPSLLPEQCFEKEDFPVPRDKLESLRLNPEAGIKTRFLLILLQLSDVLNEKVLVFSQYIEPLTLIMDQLKHSLSWIEGKEVLYMDGKRDVKQRQASINVFNDPRSEARVLLASTRACCEGISLVGASRVVLLDVVWNPSVERQAISRAYRLGQKKVVYVYHLITSETMEAKKYCRKALKVRWSNLVFSSSDGGDDEQTIAAENLQDKILDEMVHYDKLIDRIIHQPKESELIDTFGFVDN